MRRPVHIQIATPENVRIQALTFARAFSGEGGGVLADYIYTLAGFEDPIDTTNPEAALCPLKLAARSGKQALFSEIMALVRKGQQIEKEESEGGRKPSDRGGRKSA